LIHAIESMVFNLHSSLKNQKANSNNNEQNHEDLKSKVHSQQIGFTPKQYQTLLALFQESKSNDNASNLSNMTTHISNKFLSFLVLGFLIVLSLTTFLHS